MLPLAKANTIGTTRSPHPFLLLPLLLLLYFPLQKPTPSSIAPVCQKRPLAISHSASANANCLPIPQMQPEPTTPSGICLAGLSQEEQDFILKMPTVPQVKTPALPKASNKGTKRLLSDASSALTPDAEVRASAHSNANLISDSSMPSDGQPQQAGNPSPSSVFLNVFNVPGQVSVDELKLHMGA